MPRRAGKAASRRARQRSAQRSAQRSTRATSSAAQPTQAPQAAQPAAVPPVGTPDAREAVALDPPRRVSAPADAAGDSRLSGREQAEYHYVERDLRNIGVLTAAMVVLLLLAWFAFSALGLMP